jgi:hypothetical protein
MEFPLKLQPSYNQILTPTNIGIFSSVGLHAVVLGFMLPNLAEWSKSSQKGDQQNVGVIELNEAEQSRLPNTSPFSGENPFFPSTSALPNPLPNDPLLANPGLSLPPLPPSLPLSTNYNSFSNQTPLPPIPELPSYPPNLPPLSSYNNLNNIPITQSPPSLSRLPTSSDIPSRPILPPLPNTQSYFDSVRGGQGKTPARPKFGELPPSRGTDFITTAPQNPAGNSLPNLPGTVPQPQTQLQADGQETNSEQAMRNDLQWRAKLQQDGTGNTDIGTLNLPVAYPLAACPTKAEGRVVMNVTPSGEITQIQASRYSLFNELARQSLQSQRFTQPTRVIVDFNYDPKACASTVTAPNLPGLPSGTPAIPPAGNAPESVSPVNDPTRNIPQLPPLVPGSNTPNPNSAPANPQRNTIQKTSPTSPTRILQPSSPAIPTKPAIAPSPGSVPSEAPTTTTNPNAPKNSTQDSASPQGSPTPSTGIAPENKLEVKPDSKPDIKPENTREGKPEGKTDLKLEVNPKSDRNPPEKTNTVVPVQPNPVAPKPAVSSPPVSNQNPLERIRSRFFPPQPRAIPKADPTPNQSNAPTMGPSRPKIDNTPVGPSVGKKE